MGLSLLFTLSLLVLSAQGQEDLEAFDPLSPLLEELRGALVADMAYAPLEEQGDSMEEKVRARFLRHANQMIHLWVKTGSKTAELLLVNRDTTEVYKASRDVVCFKYTNPETSKIRLLFGFRGTLKRYDLDDNVALGLNAHKVDRLERSRRWVRAVLRKARADLFDGGDIPNKQLFFTGHSLGGFISEGVGRRYPGAKLISFNPAAPAVSLGDDKWPASWGVPDAAGSAFDSSALGIIGSTMLGDVTFPNRYFADNPSVALRYVRKGDILREISSLNNLGPGRNINVESALGGGLLNRLTGVGSHQHSLRHFVIWAKEPKTASAGLWKRFRSRKSARGGSASGEEAVAALNEQEQEERAAEALAAQEHQQQPHRQRKKRRKAKPSSKCERQQGSCGNILTTRCGGGTYERNLCPGPWNIQCCKEAPKMNASQKRASNLHAQARLARLRAQRLRQVAERLTKMAAKTRARLREHRASQSKADALQESLDALTN